MHVSFYPYRRQQIYKNHAQYLQRKSPSFFTAHYATLNMHIKVLLQGYFFPMPHLILVRHFCLFSLLHQRNKMVIRPNMHIMRTTFIRIDNIASIIRAYTQTEEVIY